MELIDFTVDCPPLENQGITKPYTYYFPPTWREDLKAIPGLNLEDEQIDYILSSAPRINNYHSGAISPKLLNYLRGAFHITPISDDPWEHTHTFIYKNQEGYIDIVPGHGEQWVMGIFLTEEINKAFYEELGGKEAFSRKNLAEFLNPNYGGMLTKERIEIAIEILL